MSYTAPVGGEASQGLWDSSYDGRPALGEMQGGLGRLVDGEYGADNYRLDIGYGKGKAIFHNFLISPYINFIATTKAKINRFLLNRVHAIIYFAFITFSYEYKPH